MKTDIKYEPYEVRDTGAAFYRLAGLLGESGRHYAVRQLQHAVRDELPARGLTSSRLTIIQCFITGYDSANTLPAASLANASKGVQEATYAGIKCRQWVEGKDEHDLWDTELADLRRICSSIRKAAVERIYHGEVQS